jgi:flagellar biosynthesis/type III secretory pathway protein FliH
MTTSNGTLNARTARKSLADQIDRLDGILDGLAEALNESVADAVKDVIAQAVRSAVETAVKEVLSSPDLLRAALEKHAPMPAAPINPSAPEPKPPTLKENVARIADRLCEKAKQATSLAKKKTLEVCAAACAAGKQAGKVAAIAPAVLGAIARKAWDFRKPCAVAVGVGVLCGAACYLGGQLFSSVANGLSGAAVTLSALTLPLKRLFWGGNR